MPPEAWVSIASQMPALLIFVGYLIYDGRTRQRSVQSNHEEWREWLRVTSANQLAWTDEQGRTWRSWVDARDLAHVEAMRKMNEDRARERQEMMETLKHLDMQTGRLIEMLREKKK